MSQRSQASKLQATSLLQEADPITVPCLTREALAVRTALVEKGLETPMVDNGLTRDQKVERIEGLMTRVAETLGLDLADDSLTETPNRIARMYVDEVFSGLDYTQFPKITQIENKMGVEEMIKVRDISVISTCEHHFVTIDGRARVAYMPKDKVIGLSKINRIVRFFARRPQVQERLTHQILVALQTLLEVEDVAVHIDATHYCVKARGVQDADSQTETIALGGRFKTNTEYRREFMG
ncbi:GTP cyclohydrolase I FolE [Marinobacter nanhaiticus D15-8W]|uniref:GTP cyclohydrolase 1 n=1 Tax=Marinobacter nanhaiticus D15-8W TaxID=626887 RepID=N6VXI7_9GAMM|nr:GTP cyclohydrolase I FolE [Marinobacter nanhaiticus]ENO14980.1 GTP cyclohydrolase I FolE [Marinobacter nanhaiticus D15-8W]BES69324.1 GTP cyclohydrolase I FolE [Marinobacter nanhaiticus D15-8W]